MNTCRGTLDCYVVFFLNQVKFLVVSHLLRKHKIVVIGIEADVKSIAGSERPGTVPVLISCQELDVKRTRHCGRVKVKIVLMCSQIKSSIVLSYCYVGKNQTIFTDLLPQ